MKIVNAYKDFWKKFLDFSGRTSRSDFWFYVLGAILVGIVTSVIDGIIGTPVLGPIVTLASIIPAIAIYARRLHDINKSGWWQLLALIPLVGAIILIVWFATKGDQDKNKYGANPVHTQVLPEVKPAM